MFDLPTFICLLCHQPDAVDLQCTYRYHKIIHHLYQQLHIEILSSQSLTVTLHRDLVSRQRARLLYIVQATVPYSLHAHSLSKISYISYPCISYKEAANHIWGCLLGKLRQSSNMPWSGGNYQVLRHKQAQKTGKKDWSDAEMEILINEVTNNPKFLWGCNFTLPQNKNECSGSYYIL